MGSKQMRQQGSDLETAQGQLQHVIFRHSKAHGGRLHKHRSSGSDVNVHGSSSTATDRRRQMDRHWLSLAGPPRDTRSAREKEQQHLLEELTRDIRFGGVAGEVPAAAAAPAPQAAAAAAAAIAAAVQGALAATGGAAAKAGAGAVLIARPALNLDDGGDPSTWQALDPELEQLESNLEPIGAERVFGNGGGGTASGGSSAAATAAAAATATRSAVAAVDAADVAAPLAATSAATARPLEGGSPLDLRQHRRQAMGARPRRQIALVWLRLRLSCPPMARRSATPLQEPRWVPRRRSMRGQERGSAKARRGASRLRPDAAAAAAAAAAAESGASPLATLFDANRVDPVAKHLAGLRELDSDAVGNSELLTALIESETASREFSFIYRYIPRESC